MSLVLSLSGSLTAQQKQASADTVKIAGANGQLDKGVRVTGIIKEAATGKPLPAINVSVPDFSAALTDDNGKFSIQVPAYDATIFISAEGFQSKEIALKGRNNFVASLYEENFMLAG